MTTTTTIGRPIQIEVRRTAAALVTGLLERDFDLLGRALTDEVQLRALLPRGPHTVTGRQEVADQFRTWFGHWTDLVPLESGVAQVGPRLHVHWRARVREVDSADLLIEQHVLADRTTADGSGRFARLDLLCTGFVPERSW